MDPCKPLIESYLSCVEGKTRGLSEGDECKQEAEIYKKCRKEHNKKRKNSDAQEPSSSTTTVATK
jgi:hypothetical protein